MMSAAGRVARFTVLIGAALLLQVSLVAQFSVGGRIGDLLLLLAVSAGVNGGPERGALIGAACGLASDLVVQTPFGMSMLSTAVIGYAAGAASYRFVDGGVVLRSLAVGLLSASGVGLFVVFGWLLQLTYVTEGNVALVVALIGISSAAFNPLVERPVRWGLLIRPNFAGSPA